MLCVSDGQSEESETAAWELVRAAQQGDTEAFGRLYDRYSGDVHRYVCARLPDRCLAEDVTNETFLRAFRAIGSVTYRGRGFRAWLVRIARNIVLDVVKSGYHRREIVTDSFAEDDRVHKSAEYQAMLRATRAMLWRCVERLTPDQRQCLHLRFELGMSVAETALVMDRNAQAVRQLQHRAARKLAGLLEPERSCA